MEPSVSRQPGRVEIMRLMFRALLLVMLSGGAESLRPNLSGAYPVTLNQVGAFATSGPKPQTEREGPVCPVNRHRPRNSRMIWSVFSTSRSSLAIS